MKATRLQAVRYRLWRWKDRIRILLLNLMYGWTTEEERYECAGDGFTATESASHFPANPHSHPLLREAFESGAKTARSAYAEDDEERYAQEMADTYAAINRDEMGDVFDECLALGLVTSSGRVLPRQDLKSEANFS
ncbi:MAG TPA: hypothetical protein VEC35_09375 [Noviherbaspirillum sp.]|nr:hypothetical protein [Noviherbaspirillum sp.]